MLEIASQIILCLLLAALLGFIIGYLFGKMSCAGDDCTEDTQDDIHVLHDTHNTHTSDTLETKSAQIDVDNRQADSSIVQNQTKILDAPRDGKGDNLCRIKGVGTKLQESLNKIGIYHFDQIAAWTQEDVAWADETLGFPGRVKRENWIEQAKILARGEETEFSKRVDAGEVETSKQA